MKNWQKFTFSLLGLMVFVFLLLFLVKMLEAGQKQFDEIEVVEQISSFDATQEAKITDGEATSSVDYWMTFNDGNMLIVDLPPDGGNFSLEAAKSAFTSKYPEVNISVAKMEGDVYYIEGQRDDVIYKMKFATDSGQVKFDETVKLDEVE